MELNRATFDELMQRIRQICKTNLQAAMIGEILFGNGDYSYQKVGAIFQCDLFMTRDVVLHRNASSIVLSEATGEQIFEEICSRIAFLMTLTADPQEMKVLVNFSVWALFFQGKFKKIEEKISLRNASFVTLFMCIGELYLFLNSQKDTYKTLVGLFENTIHMIPKSMFDAIIILELEDFSNIVGDRSDIFRKDVFVQDAFVDLVIAEIHFRLKNYLQKKSSQDLLLAEKYFRMLRSVFVDETRNIVEKENTLMFAEKYIVSPAATLADSTFMNLFRTLDRIKGSEPVSDVFKQEYEKFKGEIYSSGVFAEYFGDDSMSELLHSANILQILKEFEKRCVIIKVDTAMKMITNLIKIYQTKKQTKKTTCQVIETEDGPYLIDGKRAYKISEKEVKMIVVDDVQYLVAGKKAYTIK